MLLSGCKWSHSGRIDRNRVRLEISNLADISMFVWISRAMNFVKDDDDA
jgi:hypothetical protein